MTTPLDTSALDLPTDKQALHLAILLACENVRGTLDAIECDRQEEELPEPAFSALGMAYEHARALVRNPPDTRAAYEVAAFQIAAVMTLAADAIEAVAQTQHKTDTVAAWGQIARGAAQDAGVLARLCDAFACADHQTPANVEAQE